MSEVVRSIFSSISLTHLNMLLLLGLALSGGTIGGRLFQKLRIPQVVGYIIVGVLVGQSGLGLVDQEVAVTMRPFSTFALGLIGFMIGGELKASTLRSHGKQFLYILLAEGLVSFVAVAALVIIVGTFLLADVRLTWSLGLLLGAIASATAPAATTDVLWEYRSRGPLTTTILGIVALDDGLALMLFALASGVAASLMGSADADLLHVALVPVYEIVGSIAIGVLLGLALAWILRRTPARDRTLAFAIGTVLLVLGVAEVTNMDMLLAAMSMGVTVANAVPRRSREAFELVGSFTPPIYVLFFVLFGAKLNLGAMSTVAVVLAVVYLIGRTGGKMLGATLGARLSSASQSVQRYLPMCLFSQAGVAIGLSILAGERFPDEIGNTILVVITATTFVVQILGPPSTRWAIVKAGEAGMNVTDEDVIRTSYVRDAMESEIALVREGMPLRQVMDLYARSAAINYPVVNADCRLVGVITVESIKSSLMASEIQGLLLAHDLMEPAVATTRPDTPLGDARDLMGSIGVDHLPVIDGEGKLVGFLEQRAIQRFVSRQRLAREQQLASMR